jgi:biopolymer transport protein ExbB/TolQ
MSLSVQPEHAGKTARCPGCEHKFTVPKPLETPAAEQTTGANSAKSPVTRLGWVESDPANPNVWVALGVGMGIMAGILLIGLILRQTYIYTLLYERGWVNFAETFVFSWGMGIIVLKFQKLAHQKNALLLDVLPQRFGREINSSTVGLFIDHVYKLPKRLRDSLMVNRIRKGLELFEVRPNNADVAHMMSTQSDIDSIRIAGSYSLIKVFIWAIPILGFVGTVLGLSAAIGNFQGVMGGAKDIDSLMGSLGGVTSGLGTSFDTTLLGLVYSIFMSFPMSALQKSEDDNLNSIDAFCNETLLPRLNDGGGSSSSGGDIGGTLDRVVEKLMKAQKQFFTDLNDSSKLVREQVENLEKRANQQSEAITKSYVEIMRNMQQHTNETLDANVNAVTAHIAAMEKALTTLNSVLQAVGERQVHVELQPRGFFARLFGRR